MVATWGLLGTSKPRAVIKRQPTECLHLLPSAESDCTADSLWEAAKPVSLTACATREVSEATSIAPCNAC